jgi:hypothetical protein
MKERESVKDVVDTSLILFQFQSGINDMMNGNIVFSFYGMNLLLHSDPPMNLISKIIARYKYHQEKVEYTPGSSNTPSEDNQINLSNAHFDIPFILSLFSHPLWILGIVLGAFYYRRRIRSILSL